MNNSMYFGDKAIKEFITYNTQPLFLQEFANQYGYSNKTGISVVNVRPVNPDCTTFSMSYLNHKKDNNRQHIQFDMSGLSGLYEYSLPQGNQYLYKTLKWYVGVAVKEVGKELGLGIGAFNRVEEGKPQPVSLPKRLTAGEIGI